MLRELLCVLNLHHFFVCFRLLAFLGAVAESRSGSLLPEPGNTRKLKQSPQVVQRGREKLTPSSWDTWHRWAGAAALGRTGMLLYVSVPPQASPSHSEADSKPVFLACLNTSGFVAISRRRSRSGSRLSLLALESWTAA